MIKYNMYELSVEVSSGGVVILGQDYGSRNDRILITADQVPIVISLLQKCANQIEKAKKDVS